MSQASTWEGIPSEVGAFTTDHDGAVAIVRPAEKVLTMGAVLNGVLRQMHGPAFIVVDTRSGRVFATDDMAGTKGALQTALAGAEASIELVPDSGQSGRAVQWHTENPNGWEWLQSVTDPHVLAVKPAKTVESILQASVLKMWQASGQPLFAAIDQGTGRVKFYHFHMNFVANVSDALALVNPSGQCIGVKLNPKSNPNFV